VNSNLTFVGLQNATYVFGIDPLFEIWVNAINGTDVCTTIIGNVVQEKNVTYGQSFTAKNPVVGCTLAANEMYVLKVLPRFGQTSLAFGQSLQISLDFVPLVGQNNSFTATLNKVTSATTWCGRCTIQYQRVNL